MGLDTFPLLQDRTDLFAYKQSVFKLKLEYQNVSQQIKNAFVQVVSERAAHCQIEDVCRAVLYNIEREQPISAIQSEHFLIYPEIHRWPLASKVQFFIHRKQFSCHQDLILLKIFCKTDVVSAHDQNHVEVFSSNTVTNVGLSDDLSQAKLVTEMPSNNNNSTSCPMYTDNKKTISEVVSDPETSGPVCEDPAARLCSIKESVGQGSNNAMTILPQQHCNKVSRQTATGQQLSCHLKMKHLETGFTTKTVVAVLSDESTLRKTMEPSLVGRNDNNVSRKTKHPVNVTQKYKTRRSAQESSNLVNSELRNQTTSQTEVPQNEIQHIHDKAEYVYSSDLQAGQGAIVLHSLGSRSASSDGQTTSDQREVISKRNKQVTPTRITRSQLQKRSVCNVLGDGFIRGERRHVASQKKTQVSSSTSHQNLVTGVKIFVDSKIPTQTNRKKYTHEGNKSVSTCDTTKGNMKHEDTCGDMKLHRSFEITDKNIVELSCDGRILYESEKIIDHKRVAPVSPSVTVRNQNRRQSTSPVYSHSTNQYQISRSQSAERTTTRKLCGQVNCADIAPGRRYYDGYGTLPAKRARGDSSHISVHSQRIATKFNFSGEKSGSQTDCGIIPQKQISLKRKEKAVNKELIQTTRNQGIYLFDNLKQTATSHSDSSLSGDTDMSSRSLRSQRKGSRLSPELSSGRASSVPDAVVEAQQHLLRAKDGVWLFWKS